MMTLLHVLLLRLTQALQSSDDGYRQWMRTTEHSSLDFSQFFARYSPHLLLHTPEVYSSFSNIVALHTLPSLCQRKFLLLTLNVSYRLLALSPFFFFKEPAPPESPPFSPPRPSPD